MEGIKVICLEEGLGNFRLSKGDDYEVVKEEEGYAVYKERLSGWYWKGRYGVKGVEVVTRPGEMGYER